jgi:predicted RNase H-like HicB family nuclease
MEKIFTAHIEKDIETNYFVGSIPSIPGAHTQAKSLDELTVRLKEVLELCLEEMSNEEKDNLSVFFGTQQIAIAV